MRLATDSAVLLARRGYLFPASLDQNARQQLAQRHAVVMRLLGRRAMVVSGDEGVRFFYDNQLMKRRRAVPAPISLSLFGAGAVHGLDDDAHRHRKQLFRSALSEDELDRLVSIAERRWAPVVRTWANAGAGDVWAAAVEVFGSSIIEWAGIEEPELEKRKHARMMAQIVDGFGVPGPPYLAAALARRRANHWAASQIRRARSANPGVQPGSWLHQVAHHVDHDGAPLPEETAAVELLNVLRPTVAVSWLAAFGAVALAEHPLWRDRLRKETADGGATPVAEAFAHEVRRYYPFVPVLAARTKKDVEIAGLRLPRGHRVLLDVWGTNHGDAWAEPWTFDPSRFLGTDPCEIASFVPQGGGDPDLGHRCPGEGVSNRLLQSTVRLLADLDGLDLPLQDRQFSLTRMPTRPRSRH